MSADSIIAGIALLARERNRHSKLQTYFALLLICIGYLLGTFILIDYDVIAYTGIFRLSHDLAALLFGACLVKYVRYSINLGSLKVWTVAPAAIYLFAWLLFGEAFYNRIDIVHLDAAGFTFTLLALFTYLGSLRQQSFVQQTLERKLNVELVFGTILRHGTTTDSRTL